MKLILICAIFFINITSNNLIFSRFDENTCQKLNQTVSFLQRAIPNQEIYGMKPFSTNCEKNKIYGFNIHDMLDTTNYISYNKGNFKMIKNHLYHFYSWEYSLSTNNLLYIDKEGNMTFFEAVNCSNRGNSLEEVREFISQAIVNEDSKRELLKVLPFYRDFGFYIGHCGNDRVFDCK